MNFEFIKHLPPWTFYILATIILFASLYSFSNAGCKTSFFNMEFGKVCGSASQLPRGTIISWYPEPKDWSNGDLVIPEGWALLIDRNSSANIFLKGVNPDKAIVGKTGGATDYSMLETGPSLNDETQNFAHGAALPVSSGDATLNHHKHGFKLANIEPPHINVILLRKL